ncbi:hypothetical protein ACFSQP_06190 [Bizionia sediminis]|uniref:LSU ribosomal protein L21p n=1 Tax=Bizionia sediminis TaxID=1737064 RepID=A0ABW5KST5_9FLAO
MNWWFIGIVVTAFVCILLGYWVGNRRKRRQPHVYDESVWKSKVAKLENDLKACKAAQQLIVFNPDKAAAFFGKNITENDLTLIKGVDAKTAKLLQNSGFKTWKMLAEAPVESFQKILDAAGPDYQKRNPGTWSEQAKLAYEGSWKALYEWQKHM